MCAIYIYKCSCGCLSINLHPHILCCFVTDCVYFLNTSLRIYSFFQRAHAGAGKEDGKTCKRVAIRTTIRKDDCRSNAPVGKGAMQADFKPLHVPCQRVPPPPQVTIYSCDGKCPSATIFNFNINSHARFCKCCRENGLQTRTVTLYCSRNATVVDYSFQEPVDCSCQWN